MIIGHLPLGYLIGLALRRKIGQAKGLMAMTMLGSILPDIDFLRFYLIDNHQYNHRYYFTHWPLFWIMAAAIVLPVIWRFRRDWFAAALGMFLGVASHLVAGPLRPFAPFDKTVYQLVIVPSLYGNVYLNAIFHWTFWTEIALCATAFVVWRRGCSRPEVEVC